MIDLKLLIINKDIKEILPIYYGKLSFHLFISISNDIQEKLFPFKHLYKWLRYSGKF